MAPRCSPRACHCLPHSPVPISPVHLCNDAFPPASTLSSWPILLPRPHLCPPLHLSHPFDFHVHSPVPFSHPYRHLTCTFLTPAFTLPYLTVNPKPLPLITPVALFFVLAVVVCGVVMCRYCHSTTHALFWVLAAIPFLFFSHLCFVFVFVFSHPRGFLFPHTCPLCCCWYGLYMYHMSFPPFSVSYICCVTFNPLSLVAH